MVTYGIVAIVKNEAGLLPNIHKWLDFVPAERWTICDTGSMDGTGTLLEGWGVKVWDDEWVNFGYNRSHAFEAARFTADWLFALDADMEVEIDEDFEPDPQVEAYMVEFGNEGFRYRLPLLLRGDLPWESVGPVHEVTQLPDRPYIAARTDKVRIRNTGAHPHTREKFRWHAEMLEGWLADHPDDSRATFYLAQTYRDLNDPRAIEWYDRRIKMGGWEQETFYAKYQRALLLPTWPARMLALMEAWEFRPERLEPVHALVRELNLRGLHQAALAFGRRPAAATNDILFVHQSVWDYELTFERSIAEWWAGDRGLAYEMMEYLLTNPRLPDNLREATISNLGYREAA